MFKTLPGILFVLLSGAVLAQTGDSMPPPNEGVCDELIGGTPGLYGLCVAFSEAQDCEPEFTLDNPFEDCTPSSPKLLEIYDKKKTEADPPMPGVAYGCPCWTEEEIIGLRYPTIDSARVCTFGDGVIMWGVLSTASSRLPYRTVVYADNVRGRGQCSFYERRIGEGGLIINIERNFYVDDADAYDECILQIYDSGLDRGFDCFVQ